MLFRCRLRERKKAETWTALHEAAASLALQHGVEQTTVEAIAASAGVSPRTFFNYFQAKEDAILGLREPVLEESLLHPASPPPRTIWWGRLPAC